MTKRSFDELEIDDIESSMIEATMPFKKTCISWQCIYCDLDNHPSSKICLSCKSWICQQCNIINPFYETLCTQCQSLTKEEESNNIEWSCIRCTMLNNNNDQQCQICNTPKQEMIIDKNNNNNINQWSCMLCTFLNDQTSMSCEMCQTSKPNVDNMMNHNMMNDNMMNDNHGTMKIKCEIDENIMKLAKEQLAKFGHKEFRQCQYSVIQSLIKGNNTMLILPTGGGKSICFQVPILCLNEKYKKEQGIRAGIGIIISPLISLMNDQIYKLKSIGIDAEFINSSLTKSQRNIIEDKLKNNKISMLYCAPELFTSSNSDNIINILQNYRIITLFVIDEAHCISEWGHSFRPSYTKLSFIRNILNNPVTMICTATATKQVRNDILKQLNLTKNSCKIHIASFDRKNIFIKCIKMNRNNDNNNNIENIIQREIELYYNNKSKTNKSSSVIIYCGTRKETEITEKYLRKNIKSRKHKIGSYHAGLSDKQRKYIQYEFINNNINIITATNAFGMGIDKDNVDLIIHKTSPSSIEEYYQQIGRSGRNGQLSTAVIITGNTQWIGTFAQFIVQSDNPNKKVLQSVCKIICNQYQINKQKTIKLGEILKKTGYNFRDNVTTQSISICIKIMEKYQILKRIKPDLLPLKIKFLNNNGININHDTNHWRLWCEICNRARDENNEINVFIFKLRERLKIQSKDLTKSLQYLKNKKLIIYQCLRRSGAIILLTKEWENKINWNEVKMNRENALKNQEKMKQLIESNICRRQSLLRYFDQHYVIGSNPRCCDVCHPYI